MEMQACTPASAGPEGYGGCTLAESSDYKGREDDFPGGPLNTRCLVYGVAPKLSPSLSTEERRLRKRKTRLVRRTKTPIGIYIRGLRTFITTPWEDSGASFDLRPQPLLSSAFLLVGNFCPIKER
ncbi:hypothetical protein KM043_010910 [Ampulex compressa]|nr:hypothetical protein KM043_010910 [Ampulex compressa]